jgi:hypothetical protein
MVFLDSDLGSGIQLIHKFIRGDGPTYPNYYFFGSITDTDNINDELTDFSNEFIRKDVTWSRTGSNSQYEVSLLTTEANGSYINIEGLTAGATENTGSIYTVDSSIIFDKNNTFFVQVEGEVIVKN